MLTQVSLDFRLVPVFLIEILLAAAVFVHPRAKCPGSVLTSEKAIGGVGAIDTFIDLDVDAGDGLRQSHGRDGHEGKEEDGDLVEGLHDCGVGAGLVLIEIVLIVVVVS